MSRFWVVLSVFWALVASGWAAFDLQFVSKFNSLLPTDTSLNKVIPNGSGGFYAAGKVGRDVLLAEFDQFGTLVRSTRWDSPQVLNDTPIRLDRSSDTGVLTLTVNALGTAQGRVFLIQFSPTLAVNWTKELLVFSSDFVMLTATCRDGVTCVALVTTGLQLKVIRADGTDGPQRTLAGVLPFDLEPANTSSNRGFVVAGRRNNQAFVSRFTVANNASLYETETTISPGPQNLVRQIVVDGTGTVFGVGSLLDAALSRASLFKVSPTGTLTSALGPIAASPVSIALGGPTQARALIQNSDTTRDILEFDRETLTVGRTYDTPLARTFAGVENSSLLYTSDTTTSTTAFNTTTGLLTETLTGLTLIEMTALTLNSAAGVGSDGLDGALVATFNGTQVSASSHVLSGALTRNLVDSDIGLDGSVATLSSHSRFGRSETTTTLHRPDGTLAFARAFAFGNAEVLPRKVKVMSNGTVVAVGATVVGGVQALAVTRYSATGAVSFSRTYAMQSGLRSVRSLAEVGNDLLLHGIVGSVDEAIARIAANGTVVFDRNIPSSKLIVASPMAVLNGGDRVGIMVVRVNNNMDVNLISTANGNVLTQTTFATGGTWFEAFAKTTPTGDLFIAGTENGDTRLGVLSRTNLSTLQTAQIPAFTSAADFGSTSRTVLVTELGSERKIRMLSPTFSQLSETLIDATITRIADVSLDSTNIAYLLAEETPQLEVTSVYSAKYLATGARSAVRRLSGQANKIRAVPSFGVWMTGATQERTKGFGPFVAKFSF